MHYLLKLESDGFWRNLHDTGKVMYYNVLHLILSVLCNLLGRGSPEFKWFPRQRLFNVCLCNSRKGIVNVHACEFQEKRTSRRSVLNQRSTQLNQPMCVHLQVLLSYVCSSSNFIVTSFKGINSTISQSNLYYYNVKLQYTENAYFNVINTHSIHCCSVILQYTEDGYFNIISSLCSILVTSIMTLFLHCICCVTAQYCNTLKTRVLTLLFTV